MQRGNMGRKMERGAQATRTVLHNLRSPAALVRYLYEGGRAHWAPARKHAWLAQPRVSTKWGTLSARDSRATRA